MRKRRVGGKAQQHEKKGAPFSALGGKKGGQAMILGGRGADRGKRSFRPFERGDRGRKGGKFLSRKKGKSKDFASIKPTIRRRRNRSRRAHVGKGREGKGKESAESAKKSRGVGRREERKNESPERRALRTHSDKNTIGVVISLPGEEKSTHHEEEAR